MEGWIEFSPRNKKEEKIKDKLIKSKKIREYLIQKFLATILEREGLRPIRTGLNLWDLIGPYRTPLEVLNRYYHPLQPDIDILCVRGGEKVQTPLIGFEVKVFTRYNQIVIPKTSEDKGYYSGIEQALSLLTYGLDYASLWHVFIVPLEEWGRRADMKQIIEENVEWTACYTQFIDQAFIKNLNLPIGYRATAINIGRDRDKILYYTFYKVSAPPNHVFAVTPARIRLLLINRLKIEETVYQRRFLEELARTK